jgi:hypothetical protein
MRNPRIPDGAEVVRTYAEYGQFVESFFRGHYQLLILVGRPGLSKSFEFEQRLGRAGHLIRGWAAPLQAYIEAYRHRNKLLVFDDAEVLWKRPGGRILIRSLAEHRSRKHVQWRSTTRELSSQGIPQSFTTTSKVAIIANRFVFGAEDEREAVLDRAHLVYFDPTPLEVHTRVADWYWDQTIFDHIGERLHMLDEVSARTYIKAWERRMADGDWKKLIEETYCHKSTTLLVQALEFDPRFETVDQRLRHFTQTSGMCRATYFNIKRRLRDNEQLRPIDKVDVPKKLLRGSPPIDEPVDELVDGELDGENVGPNRTPNNFPGANRHGVPPWCDYSDDPSDYADFSDFAADWWKRPQSKKTDDEEEPNFGNDKCAWLRREMYRAIQREDYERAAELRDEIHKHGGSEGDIDP